MALGKNKPTIAVDFDGVIHRYSKGWHDGSAYDPPMEGAIKYIKKLMEEYAVYVFSTRPVEQIQDWFGKYGEQTVTEIIPKDQLYWTKMGVLGLANHKVIAYILLDDRAIRFEGNWERAYMSIKNVIAGEKIAHDGETSDGYHTFNELYDHRIALFIALMKSQPKISWRSELHSDGTMFEGWFIAGMNLPTGSITYHLPVKYFYDLPGIKILERAPEWDGHTPDDTVRRLLGWRNEPTNP